MDSHKDRVKKYLITFTIIVVLDILCVLLLWISKGEDYKLYYSAIGCLSGGFVGGIGTLIAVVITTEETRKIQQENKKNIMDKDYFEDVKRNKPILILKEQDLGTDYAKEVRFNIGTIHNTDVNLKEIKNVGIGIAKDIKISLITKNNSNISDFYINLLEKDGIIREYSIKNSQGNRMEGNVEKIKIECKDIFDNLYCTIYDVEEFKIKYKVYLKITKIQHNKKIINSDNKLLN
ncbi:hypothetical protein [Clostridium taeniosporum]|uniref:Uncharacterized protein n=1 Tax=Clostridium taeniosporum TaxID=394958 RepID=A0A1D7XP05_9CLOT|nr:hypothetical protein [Clostridium taeniosporum]AOR25058.1 hypothetical protein BGI42_15025 [Clostridium taeniosporum]